jgi:hypothetical protein
MPDVRLMFRRPIISAAHTNIIVVLDNTNWRRDVWLSGSQTTRSAGSIRRCSGRWPFMLSRNHVIVPVQPTRSAITVAGISGVSFNDAWMMHCESTSANIAIPRFLRDTT